ncbi:hypothetical protein VNO77_26894 [Canavalia gladiata]|uniref:Uncharacterized protein n=1 Tax=Canavalia gladiata TaxID=3824 RepID=A0AAN9KVX9_CANGL
MHAISIVFCIEADYPSDGPGCIMKQDFVSAVGPTTHLGTSLFQINEGPLYRKRPCKKGGLDKMEWVWGLQWMLDRTKKGRPMQPICRAWPHVPKGFLTSWIEIAKSDTNGPCFDLPKLGQPY